MSALHSYWKCHLQNIADADRGIDIRTDASIEFTRFINQISAGFQGQSRSIALTVSAHIVAHVFET